MISINLYQPGKLNIYLQFPTEWDELLPDEVIEICKHQLLSTNNQHIAKASILHFIIHSRAKLQKVKLPPRWVDIADPEQLVTQGYPLLDFIYDDNTLTQAPENCIKLPGLIPVTVYGPLKSFQHITCGEFEDAEIYFNQFFDEPDAEPLARMAAILWRPAKKKHYLQLAKNGTYKTYNAEKLIKRFRKLAPWRLYAIFTWYTGCKSQLPLLFPTVYEKHSAGNDDEPDGMAFTKCIHAGAGPKNGTRNDIRMTKLFEFMYDMEEEAIKAKELKQQYDELTK